MWKIHGNQHKSTISRWFLNHDFGNKNIQSHPTKLSIVVPWFSHGFLQVSRPPAAWSVTSLRRAAAFRAPPAPGRAAAPPGHEAGPGGSMRPGPGDRTGGLGGTNGTPIAGWVYDVYDGKSHENPMKIPWKSHENGWKWMKTIGVA